MLIEYLYVRGTWIHRYRLVLSTAMDVVTATKGSCGMPHESESVEATASADIDMSAALPPLFHGTRRSAADSIGEQGFRPLPVVAQIAAVARVRDIPVETLSAHMRAHGRFAHLDDRPGTVSLTADPDQAGRWANRAPEATWDALRSAYDLLNPERGDEWNRSGRGRFWVLARQIVDPPVVLAVAAPTAALRSWSFSAGPSAVDLLAAAGAEGFAEQYMEVSEWRAEAGLVTVLAVHDVPTRLDRDDVAFMCDADAVTIDEQIRQGVWGDPGGYDHAGMPWWSFTEVWGRLADERRAELEALAGHPLDGRR